MEALNAGASAYVLKGVGAPELMAIVSQVAAGESYVSPGLAARLLVAMQSRNQKALPNETPPPPLTAREEQILKLVAEGLSNKEIGRKLDLQEKTVKYYLSAVFQKLSVRNRVEAAMKARDMFGMRGDA